MKHQLLFSSSLKVLIHNIDCFPEVKEKGLILNEKTMNNIIVKATFINTYVLNLHIIINY